jgi:mono/diheme cytochrome c family protein
MSLEFKPAFLTFAAFAVVLGLTLGLLAFLPSGSGAESTREAQTNTVTGATGAEDAAKRGYRLFEHNCAHCHGEDARGDEGPDLHGLRRSDSRLIAIITGGIKGEMPAFAKKFQDADLQALIAYLRTLKD